MNNAATTLRAAERFARGRFAKTPTRIPGNVLTLYRQASGVDAIDVARELGVSKQRIGNVERDGCPREYAERYRVAVENLVA